MKPPSRSPPHQVVYAPSFMDGPPAKPTVVNPHHEVLHAPWPADAKVPRRSLVPAPGQAWRGGDLHEQEEEDGFAAPPPPAQLPHRTLLPDPPLEEERPRTLYYREEGLRHAPLPAHVPRSRSPPLGEERQMFVEREGEGLRASLPAQTAHSLSPSQESR
ncbi:hypothetical protein ACP4OV_003334 [Aristida adscensionis]